MTQAATRHRADPYPSRCGGRGRVLERDEPVVYSDVRTVLTESQAERFERNGFMLLDDLLDDGEIAALQRELERLRKAAPDLRQYGVISEPGEPNALRSIFRVHEHSPLLRRLSRDARLVRRAEEILGSRVYVHQSRLNYKPGFRGKEFYWHSDFETWHVEDGMPRMRAVSISINLSENTEYNGPLMLIPGSHRQFIACIGETPDEHYKQSLRKQEYGVPNPEFLLDLVEQGGIETVTGPPGTSVCFDCNVMHGSNGNITPLPRSNIFIVYNSIENAVCAPFGPENPRPEFLAERSRFEPVEAVEGRLPTSAGGDFAG